MKSIELFAGIGGISLAAEWAGIETVALCERDSFCQKVLKKHWPEVPIFDDVKTLNRPSLEERGIDVRTIELVSGGFPCQPYSVAGRKKGREDDRDLWPEMFRIIREIRPTWIVGENVANFANMELERTCSDLEKEGYETQSFVIPACAVNAKHRRERTFIIGCAVRNIPDPNGAVSWGGGTINQTNKQRWRETDAQSKGVQSQNNETRSNNFKSLCQDLAESKKQSGTGARWEPEPNVGRVANGVPNRVDRLRSLGNAVVPQQIYPIFKAIMEVS